MRSSTELRFSPWDLSVAAAILLLSLVCWLPLRTQAAAAGLTAIVSADSRELDRIRLDTLTGETQRKYTAGGETLIIVFTPDGAAVLSSTCPTQDCVHTGRIDRAGQGIVCLPARFSIRLAGADSGGVDAVVG